MKSKSKHSTVTKTLTGIKGFDEITDGGLPRGRTTLVMGGPGCGKTVFALQALVHSAKQTGLAGVFVAFEESASDLVANFASLGFDLARAEAFRREFDGARAYGGYDAALTDPDVDAVVVAVPPAFHRAPRW